MDPMLILTTAAAVLAATMTLVAWRVVREDRRRSEARVAALAADIHRVSAGTGNDLPLRDGPVGALFQGTEPQPRRRALAAAIGAGALVVGGVVALLIMVTSG